MTSPLLKKMSLPERSYVLLPYYRQFDTGTPEGAACREDPGAVGTPYDLFCVTSQIQATVPYMVTTQPVISDQRADWAIVIYHNGNPWAMNEDQYASVKKMVNDIVGSKPQSYEALLYQPYTTDVVPLWYQSWMLDTVNVDGKVRLGTNPYLFNMPCMYIDLRTPVKDDEWTFDYKSIYDDLQTSILLQLRDFYRQGVIKATEAYIEKLQLTKLAMFDDDRKIWLAAPDWDFAMHLPTGFDSPVPWLMSQLN